MQICTDDRCVMFAICVAMMEDVIISLAIAELSLWWLHVNSCRTLDSYECCVILYAKIAPFIVKQRNTPELAHVIPGRRVTRRSRNQRPFVSNYRRHNRSNSSCCVEICRELRLARRAGRGALSRFIANFVCALQCRMRYFGEFLSNAFKFSQGERAVSLAER